MNRVVEGYIETSCEKKRITSRRGRKENIEASDISV
jgi:hypothetical protein